MAVGLRDAARVVSEEVVYGLQGVDEGCVGAGSDALVQLHQCGTVGR